MSVGVAGNSLGTDNLSLLASRVHQDVTAVLSDRGITVHETQSGAEFSHRQDDAARAVHVQEDPPKDIYEQSSQDDFDAKFVDEKSGLGDFDAKFSAEQSSLDDLDAKFADEKSDKFDPTFELPEAINYLAVIRSQVVTHHKHEDGSFDASVQVSAEDGNSEAIWLGTLHYEGIGNDGAAD
jgi:hypothetical protein